MIKNENNRHQTYSASPENRKKLAFIKDNSSQIPLKNSDIVNLDDFGFRKSFSINKTINCKISGKTSSIYSRKLSNQFKKIYSQLFDDNKGCIFQYDLKTTRFYY